jgi:agmatine/peptidylarginine deiminase
MTGEFEPQRYLLMACAGDHVHSRTIARIVSTVKQRIQPVVLINDALDRRQVIEDLNDFGVDQSAVVILRVEHDSKWTRDFGPTTMLSARGIRVVDWLYSEERQLDDDVSLGLTALSETQVELLPLEIEGGNLLSNGCGLIVTSERSLQVNQELGFARAAFELADQLGATDLVVLEPLCGEETQHVDMFATFVSPTTIVVGSYDEHIDPVNAALLDRNARILSNVVTPQGRLNVVRIPMGSREGNYWRTYTNCIFANGVLLVPGYRGFDDPIVRAQVLNTYRRLLPDWIIESIDASDLIESGGALRCASLNLTDLSNPLFSTPEEEVPVFDHYHKSPDWHVGNLNTIR